MYVSRAPYLPGQFGFNMPVKQFSFNESTSFNGISLGGVPHHLPWWTARLFVSVLRTNLKDLISTPYLASIRLIYVNTLVRILVHIKSRSNPLRSNPGNPYKGSGILL